MREVEAHSLRLDTALVFDEIRTMATADERQRLAREIHDGIAQEVASLGYVVDHMAATTRDAAVAEGLADLRKELSRVVADLRLSIFDLRSDVSATNGLGSALSDYVRQIGAKSGLTVHLTLDEAPTRLSPAVEGELLRIAQEAITNARKHASAQQPVGGLLDQPAAGDADGARRRPAGWRAEGTTPTASRSCASAPAASTPRSTSVHGIRRKSAHAATLVSVTVSPKDADSAHPDCRRPTNAMTQDLADVLLIDDHDLIRQGLARAFEGQDDFHVCGQAASVAEGHAPVRPPPPTS